MTVLQQISGAKMVLGSLCLKQIYTKNEQGTRERWGCSLVGLCGIQINAQRTAPGLCMEGMGHKEETYIQVDRQVSDQIDGLCC